MRKTTTPLRIILRNSIRGPITYHRGVDEAFDCFASESGWKPGRLRKASELAIRTRHGEAIIDHESNRARGRQPNIYRLDLGSVKEVSVYYTVERHAVVIRGYYWKTVGEPQYDGDGGMIHLEFSWDSRPPKDWLYDHPEFSWLKPFAEQ